MGPHGPLGRTNAEPDNDFGGLGLRAPLNFDPCSKNTWSNVYETLYAHLGLITWDCCMTKPTHI
jgi:hypothetical protein